MTVQFCRRCGCQMLKRYAPEDLAKTVRELTGQEVVWLFLCPECYPEKIKDFLPHREVKWNGNKPRKKGASAK